MEIGQIFHTKYIFNITKLSMVKLRDENNQPICKALSKEDGISQYPLWMIQKPRKFLGGACRRTPLEPCGARLGNRSVFILDLCPGGVLIYITFTGMCRPSGSWFWSSWFRMGYSFQRRFLERGIKNCGLRLYLLLKIVAEKTGPFQFTNFLEQSINNWPISRTGYQF